MNQSINASEIRELSLNELESVSGGFINIPRIVVQTWKDGGWYLGLKGIGGIGYFPETGANVCNAEGSCTPIK